MIRTAVGWLGVGLILSAFAAGFLAYLVTGGDPVRGVRTDGFGRELFPAPFLIRLTQVDEWAGLGWWLVDMALFWGAFISGAFLAAWGFKAETEK